MNWKTEKRTINDLVPFEANPRTLSDKQAKDLEKSLKKFNLAEIPVINTDNVIIAGHQRLKMLQLLGRGDEKIDVRVPEKKLTNKQLEEYNIRSNKNTGSWDWDILANNFEVDDLIEWGFSEEELAGLDFDEPSEGLTDEDAMPEDVETMCKTGDMWQLGDHRLLCGDATKKEDVERLMAGEKADMVFTDPPYSVNYTKKNKEIFGATEYAEIKNDNLSVDETAKTIWSPVFKNLYESSKDDCSIYMTMPQGGDQMMMMMMMKESWQVKHELIWVKDAPVFSMGRLDYDYRHEPIIYGWKKKHNFYNNGEFTKSVWEIKRDGNKQHPTMKPIALIENALLNSTKSGDITIDFFGGSGSTLIASEKANRKCRIMEIDEHYCDVIIARWEEYTGKKAVKMPAKNG